MITIKLSLKDESIITHTNGTPEEVAEYYFYVLRMDLESIDILEGGQDYETKYFRRTLKRLYRISPEEQKEFDLDYTIRAVYQIEYKPEYKEQYSDHEIDFGFMRIA